VKLEVDAFALLLVCSLLSSDVFCDLQRFAGIFLSFWFKILERVSLL